MASALLAAACFSASAMTVIGIAAVSAAVRAAMTLMILSRSAISVERAVVTFSSAEIASARAVSAMVWASDCSLLLVATMIAASWATIWISRSISGVGRFTARAASRVAVATR